VPQEAIDFLPKGVGWGFLLHWPLAFVAGFVTTWGMTRLVLDAVRLKPDMHWTEKARRITSVRGVEAWGQLVFAVVVGLLATTWCGPLTRIPPKLDAVVSAVSVFLGAALADAAIQRALDRMYAFPPPVRTPKVWLQIATLAPFAVSYGLVFLIGPLPPAAAVFVIGIALAVLIWAFVGAVWLRVHLRIMRPAGPRLIKAVESAAARKGCTVPRAYEMDMRMANAFAFVWGRALCFTSGALHVLSDDEIESIACHEMAHLQEDKRTRVLRMVPYAALLLAGMVVPFGLTDTDVSRSFIFVVPVVWLLVRRFTRKLESRADDVAHQHQLETEAYARALFRLYEADALPAAHSNHGSHPQLYDRLVAVGMQPDFPRPKPPARVWVAIPLLALFAVIFFAINARERHADEPSALRLALFGGAAYDMSLWATVAQNANNAPAEIALREAALREDPDNRPLQAELLAALLRHGKCDSTMPWTEGKSTSALLAACGGQKANPTPAVR
jgi:Zn-dependent protease with chaperone function